ncbi:MAG: tetratricopeptide repeat protein [Bacteroidota bacterium]
MNKIKAIGILMGIFLSVIVSAQKTNIYTHKDLEFEKGIELFQKEKYGAAQKSFMKIMEVYTDPQSLVRIDAEYYHAICAIELFNKDGELFLKQFVKNHPESAKVKAAYFYLGKYNYRKKKYKEVLNWFEKVDVYDLTKDELAEYYFKRGYSYFVENKIVEAKKDLNEIKDIDNKYASSAKYYYAHIAYSEKNYETALKDFLLLQKNETFGSVVPFYIAQIYYLQGKYNDVISYAPALLDSVNTKRAPEIARILGESYYRTSRYKEAIPYLKKYEKAANGLQRQDNYQMGYAYYKTNDYVSAESYFVKTTDIDDSLSQNANYHIADCYLKADKKQNALTAFGRASRLNFDKVIQEDALYNYAKLCYELSFNPYNEAIKAFQKYITDYPNSSRIDEAYTYLVNVFITTKSYKEALVAIENIKTLTPELKQAYQKIAYYRGVELFNNSEFASAIKSFEQSQKYNFDKTIRANAVYWKAESYYRDKNYQKAIDIYSEYIAEPGSISRSEYSDANYNIGYAYYKLDDWNNSILWFRKFVTFKTKADEKKVNDALNRIGDGYFMTRDYSNAVDYYDQSYKMKLINADYALFQRALAYGVQKKYSEKIADLKLFIQTYSGTSSTYVQRAKFELANTYMSDNQTELALSGFKKFTEDYPNSIYENTCLSKIGLIYYNQKDDENALSYFDRLIKRDRKSPDANTAIDIVKKIYTSKGDVQKMEEYLGSVGATIPQAALDSITYNIGKTHYLEQDCNNVIKDFDKYIQKFANGIFVLQANFYKAECEYKVGNSEAALAGYTYVIGQTKSELTEQSLSRASDIVFKKQNYTQALDYYKQLEQIAENAKNSAVSKIGLMRCNYQLKRYPDAIAYANKVISLEKPNNELLNEAHFVIASSDLATEKYKEALTEYQLVANASKSENGTEAKYNVAYIQYLKNDFKQSQKTIFDLINGEGDFPYWTDKSMILLADNYVALKDNFQAKATLKGILSESDIAETKKLAQEKLDKILAAEEAEKQPKPMNEPLKIEFEGNSPQQNDLFIEPQVIKDSIETKQD